jgi:hypothetical protein
MKKLCLILIFFYSGITLSQAANADTLKIKGYLDTLTGTKVSRSYDHPAQLMKTAEYIQKVFSRYSDSIFVQEFSAEGQRYRNVICSFGTENPKRIIVGAHYDVFDHVKGADDNASGVTGLFELARLLQGQKLSYRVDIVAFCLEEPPFFGTQSMGSYMHAKYMFSSKTEVYGMISLEMIGYFDDTKYSQAYPVKLMSVKYGNKGDFITLVKKPDAGKFANEFSAKFEAAKTIKTVNFTGPEKLKGISYSDHYNYWDLGYSALMITDTSFYRNPNYHKETDTIETLDLKRMSKVIDGVYSALLAM